MQRPWAHSYHNKRMRGVGEVEREEGMIMKEKKEGVVVLEMTQGGGWECSHP